MSDHVAVVLAAGQSLRLGQPKQLLRREGETLVHRALWLAHATEPQRTLLVVGAHARQVIAAAGIGAASQVQVIHNLQWREGLGSSVRAARDALAHDTPDVARCLLLVCDQPALTQAHLQALLQAAEVAASGCAGTVHDARLGIPAAVALTRLLQAQPQGDAGLRDLLNGLAPEEVGRLQAPELALDLDTPADVAEALRRGWIDPQPG